MQETHSDPQDSFTARGRMSRVVNLSMAEADVREQCRKSAIGVSSLEVLQSGGVRLVTSSVDGAEKIRKKMKSKIVHGDVPADAGKPQDLALVGRFLTWRWTGTTRKRWICAAAGSKGSRRQRNGALSWSSKPASKCGPATTASMPSALDKLISDVTAEMRASPSPIDRVRIVPQLD